MICLKTRVQCKDSSLFKRSPPCAPQPSAMTFLSIVCSSALNIRALSDLDQSDKSCRDLGHCRSIWDIIWSCLVVILSCTWLAVHPNIPKQGKGRLWKFARSAGAFVVALIAPEFIILTAWEQRVAAHKLLATIPKGALPIDP
jgi:hypothetical protein